MSRHPTVLTSALTMSFLIQIASVANAAETTLRYVPFESVAGASAAVVVPDVPLVHTGQIYGVTPARDSVPPAEQLKTLFEQLDASLQDAGSGFNQTVKLNFYITRADLLPMVRAALSDRFPRQHKPAVSFVETTLPRPGAVVAVDAVALTSRELGREVVHVGAKGRMPQSRESSATLTPAGSRIYVAGQAERSMSLTEATRKTLDSLLATLRHMGRRDADILQLKAFVTPMAQAAEVEAEVARFFGEGPVPPLVLVEWKSSADTPIEIELVAWGGMNRTGEVVEYSTPPGMTTSPIYSRVAQIHHTPTIYVSGLYASLPATGDPAAESPAGGQREVEDVFRQLQAHLDAAGSDLKHLVKATYYVATDSSSARLNELRPNYYDPRRPPSASKAAVSGVGHPQLGLTIDMIAVPRSAEQHGALGPAEHGQGLTAADAAAGWLALFDGVTTLGWRDAMVVDGTLRGGTTSIAFGPCEVRAQFARGGTLQVGGREIVVDAGEFRLNTTGQTAPLAPIQLGEGLQVESLGVRPLELSSLPLQADLNGWRSIAHPRLPADQGAAWQPVEKDTVRATGGPGCLQFEPRLFGDFVLQLEVRTLRRHANGGVFFRARTDDFLNGYEAQVFNRAQSDDPARPAVWATGAIDDRMNARRVVSRDGEYFCYTIVAQQRRLATWINGYQQVDWHDDRPLHDNPRVGCRVAPGSLQLQAHDRDTDLEFRHVRAADWPAG